MIFLGTPAAAVPTLEAVAARTGVKLVVTRPDRRRGRSGSKTPSEVKRAATALGLPVTSPNDRAELEEALASVGPFGLGVVVAYGLLLTRSMLDTAYRGFVNVHFSLLPRWRGAAPVAAAIRAGDALTGVTLMRMTEGLDTGPVLAAEPYPIRKSANRGDLTDRLATLGAELVAENLVELLAGTLEGVPQDEKEATYAPRLTARDGLVDFAMPAEEVARHVRAMAPRPGAYAWWGEIRLRILQASGYSHPPVDLEIGELAMVRGELWCGADRGGVLLEGIQPPGKRVMPGAAWARGVRRDLGFLNR